MRWLPDPSEGSVRQALAAAVPALADAEIQLPSEIEQSNPDWCSSTAIVGGSSIVKFAWSEVAAIRVRREAGVLRALAHAAPDLPVPRLEGSSDDPVAFVTQVVVGKPLHFSKGRIAEGERSSI